MDHPWVSCLGFLCKAICQVPLWGIKGSDLAGVPLPCSGEIKHHKDKSCSSDESDQVRVLLFFREFKVRFPCWTNSGSQSVCHDTGAVVAAGEGMVISFPWESPTPAMELPPPELPCVGMSSLTWGIRSGSERHLWSPCGPASCGPALCGPSPHPVPLSPHFSMPWNILLVAIWL